jgi:uncharacterized LabA/DUF88 family protein
VKFRFRENLKIKKKFRELKVWEPMITENGFLNLIGIRAIQKSRLNLKSDFQKSLKNPSKLKNRKSTRRRLKSYYYYTFVLDSIK